MLLSELTIAAENSEQLLAELVQPREDWLDMETISGWLPSLLQMFTDLSVQISNAEGLLKWLGSSTAKARIGEKRVSGRGISGLKTEFPQHAGLRELADQTNSDVRLKMAALVVAVSYKWREELIDNELDTYRLRLEGAWRAIRLMTDAGMNRIPPISDRVEQFAAAFERRNEVLDRRVVDEKDIRYLVELQRFFRFFLGDGRTISRYRRSSDDHGRSLTGAWHVLDKDTDTEVDQSKTQATRVHLTLAADANNGHFLAGNSPDELAEENVLLETNERAKPELGELPGSLLRKLQPQRAAYRRVNSVLPGRWESLSEYELNQILESISSMAWDSETDCLFIFLLLLTGRPPESVLAARVVKSRDQLPLDISRSNTLYVVVNDRSWVSGALKPESRRKLKNDWRKYFDDSRTDLTFQIPGQLWLVMQPRFEKTAKRVTSNSAAVFSGGISLDAITNRVNVRLKALNKSTGSRLTLKRIQNSLFESLIRVSGDLVEACLISGRHPPFGQSAAIYYHTRSPEQLAEYYDRVVVSWAHVMPGTTRPNQLGLAGFGLARVGSPLSIRADVMKAVVASLQEQLEEYRKVVEQPAYLWRFHNLYTAYVNLMLLWATGYRAVRDPIADPSELNRQRRFLVISDKTGDGMTHSRVVYLPERLIQQLDRYEAHREVVAGRLLMAGYEVTLNTFFWFLTSDYEPTRATPKNLSDEIAWTFPWPLNISRHTLRGFLRDRNVPGDLVDVYMGHWGIGTEPWAKHSALDPCAFKTVIEPVIAELLVSLGFDVLGGIDG